MSHQSETSALARYAFEVGALKRLPRSGWWMAGVRDAESVADHSFRVSVLSTLLALLEGVDPGRAALLGLFHDVPESRTGDQCSVWSTYVRTAPTASIVGQQTKGIPPPISDYVQELVLEFERGESPEARVARDADKLDMLLQAIEYRTDGNANMEEWIVNARAAITSKSGQDLASVENLEAMTQWWSEVQED